MKAMLCSAYGPPENLRLAELPDPVPGPGEVVVGIRVAAVNFPDVLIMSGGYQLRMPPPFTPGSEFAGEIIATGAGASLRIGDRVCGSAMVGAFAEQVVAQEDSLRAIPDGIDFVDAAAFGVTYRTAYYALRTVAAVRADDWVVVLGAAGGVGLAAVDLAVTMQARVIAAASGPGKLDVCRQRGAHIGVDYDREDLRQRIRDITGGAGARVVLDPVGGRYSEPALRALGRGGVFVTLGYATGTIPAIPLNLVLLKGITVRGMEIRTFGTDHPDDAARDDSELDAMFAAGTVRPYIGATFGLAQTAAALRQVADRKAIGKVVVEIGG